MDKQAARAQWRGHQIKKAHAAGRGRTGGVGTQSRRAPGSARADFHELPTNYNRYDEVAHGRIRCRLHSPHR